MTELIATDPASIELNTALSFGGGLSNSPVVGSIWTPLVFDSIPFYHNHSTTWELSTQSSKLGTPECVVCFPGPGQSSDDCVAPFLVIPALPSQGILLPVTSQVNSPTALDFYVRCQCSTTFATVTVSLLGQSMLFFQPPKFGSTSTTFVIDACTPSPSPSPTPSATPSPSPPPCGTPIIEGSVSMCFCWADVERDAVDLSCPDNYCQSILGIGQCNTLLCGQIPVADGLTFLHTQGNGVPVSDPFLSVTFISVGLTPTLLTYLYFILPLLLFFSSLFSPRSASYWVMCV